MKPTIIPIGPERLQRLLSIEDLTLDPAHAISRMVQVLNTAMATSGSCYPPHLFKP